MTLKTSLVTIAVGAMLVLGVPVAWGKAQPVSSASPEVLERAVLARELSQRAGLVASPDAFERAVSAQQSASVATPYRDAFQRAEGSPLAVSTDGFMRAITADGRSSAIGSYPDAFQRVALTGSSTVVLDSHDRGTPVTSAPLSPISTGTGIEWPQVGIGFGVGLLLALGLVFTMRVTRIRPLAH